MAIQDGLRFWFAQLNLGAHFLNLRRLLFQFCFESINLLLLLRDGRSLVLYRKMFFEELIKQHRVHLVIAHAVGFSFLIAHNQIRIYVFHFLSNETELCGVFRVNLLFVMERGGLGARIVSLSLSIGLIPSLKRLEEGATPS